MRIAGLWLGYSIACVILDIGFAFIICCPWDWSKPAEKVKAEIAKNQYKSPLTVPLSPISPMAR